MTLSDSEGNLPPELLDNIRSLNPWWRDEAAPKPPPYHRWIFKRLNRILQDGLTPAVVLRGPRRVGKTVLLRQIVKDLLASAVSPSRILYLPFDELPTLSGIREPVLTLARWFERDVLGRSFNASAQGNRPAYILLDEVQNLESWAPQVKNLVDNHSVRMLITGSSSLRIEAGRDSLAGRITTVDLGPLLPREIAALRFGVRSEPIWDDGSNGAATLDFWRQAVSRCAEQADSRRQAFQAFSERGGYPAAHERKDASWPEIADYLEESIIQRALKHDLATDARGGNLEGGLLEEVFRLCCRYAGQAPGERVFVPEIRRALAIDVPWGRLRGCLDMLDATLLMRLIRPLELRLKRQPSPSKICLCDHSLRAGWLQEVVPLDPEGLSRNPHLCDLAGRLAESAAGYFLSSIPHLDVAYFPARAGRPEVDFVMTIGARRIPIEVKYRKHVDPHEDTFGLRAFLEKTAFNAPFGLLVTLDDGVVVPDPRIVPISLSSLLWLR
jgi:predicted AAA+ superfamily ATPase